MLRSGRKSGSLLGSKAAGEPSGDQLARINRYALAELSTEQVYVRTAYLAHNGIDRDREAFDSALLADFARTLPGKGLFVRHPGGWDGDSGPGVGRWFEAQVVRMSLDEARAALRQPGLRFPPGVEEAELLEASFYVPRTGKNADLIADVDAGVAADVSIGFSASRRSVIEQDGAEIGWTIHGPGEALEGSLVWLGAQPGARVAKAAGGRNEGDEMSEEQMEALRKQLDEQKAELAEAKAAVASLAALRKALGDGDAALLDDPEALAKAVGEGKAYRDQVVDDLVAAKRVAGMLGDEDAQVEAAKQFYYKAPLAVLEAELDGLRKRALKSGQMDGGDPNGTDTENPPAGGTKGADGGDLSSPLHNPALAG